MPDGTWRNPPTPGDPAGEGEDRLAPPTARAYPPALARAVHLRWPEIQDDAGVRLILPEPRLLEEVLSVCYQASLLREEGRPVTFRVAFGAPDAFAATAGPPAGLHRLLLSDWRPFDEHELRLLASAAVFSRSLIGATADGMGARIWGVIHSGAHWLQWVKGGRETPQLIPPVLIVAVAGPGRVLVSMGQTTIAELTHGTLISRGMDVFQAPWLENHFTAIGGTALAASPEGRRVAPSLGPVLARHVLRRVLAEVRSAQHGGMLIIVPRERATEVLGNGHHIRLKYPFADEEPRRRILTLTSGIIDELARAHPGRTVGWNDYDETESRQLIERDEPLFEAAQLVGDLTRVDGAVVMTTDFDLLGFGGEIAGDLPDVPRVKRALNLTGTESESVRTDRVGTRHRSAYRLCQVFRDALALVVSQDGGLRFVRWHQGGVTYWEQVATAPWEV